MPDNEDYYMTFGFGYVKSYHASLGLIQETEIFVPKDKSVKINIIRLKNTLSEKRELKLIYYLKPVLGEDETKTSGYIDLKFDKEKNVLFAKNIYGEGLSKCAYITSSEKIGSYTGNKLSFVGEGNLNSPEAINKVELSMENGLGTETCIAIELKIELDAYEDKKIVLSLGEEGSIAEVTPEIKDIEAVERQLKDTKDYWRDTLRRVQVKTEDKQIDFMLNRMGYVSDNCM